MLTAKKNYKSFKIWKIIGIIFVIIVVLTCYFSFLASKKYRYDYLDAREYYFVYVEKSKKQAELINIQSLIKNLGGAGEIISYNGFYYLVTSVYKNKSDANEIVKSLSENYKNSGFLTYKKNKVKANIKSKIIENLYLTNYFIYIDKLVLDICDMEIYYIIGKITQKQLLSELLERKLKLEDFIKNFNFNKSDDFFYLIYNTQNLYLFYLNDFFNNFFNSDKKNSLVCGLATNITMLSIDLFNKI